MKRILAIILALVMCLSAVAMLASCNKDDGTEEPTTAPETPVDTSTLEEAIAYVHQLYKDSLTDNGDYDLVKSVKIGDTVCNIDWTVSGSDAVTIVEKNDTFVTVVIPKFNAEEIQYVLKASITLNGKTETKEYTHTVPKYDVLSFEGYMAAQEGETVTVAGIVVGINSKAAGNTRNHLFLVDMSGKGGYYSYQMDKDPVADLGIEIGMTVSVTGPVAPYSGMQEIKGGSAMILDSTIKTVDVLDVTEAFANGESFANFVAMPVVIKGVTIKDQVLGGTSEYLNFELNGRTAYLRTYVTDFPTTLKAEDKATIDALHYANFGNTADVTGIVVLYNSNPYLIPMSVDCITNIKTVEKTDAEKAQIEKDNLKFDGAFADSAVVELLATGSIYTDVTITWASNNDAIVIADGKATITVGDDKVEVTLTATITCGAEVLTKEFTVTLSKEPITIPEALQLEDGSKVLVSGTVSQINTEWSEQYGNITVTIVDADGNSLYVYRLATNVKVGDVITITGVMGSYKGSKQVAQGATAVVTDPAPAEVTIPEALEMADDRRVVVTGTVSEINTAWSEQYGNITVTIVDAEGNSLYVYRMKTNVQVGDVITVSGRMATYKGNRQVAAGSTAEIAAPETPVDPETPVEGTTASVVIADLADTNAWENSKPYTTFAADANITVSVTSTPVGDYGANSGKYYENGENWRIYQNEAPVVTIAAAEGKTIKTVKVTYAVKNDGTLTLNGANVASEEVVTVNANSVEFSVGNTSDKTNGQAQITAIEVIYG